jgi:hypothetical protein
MVGSSTSAQDSAATTVLKKVVLRFLDICMASYVLLIEDGMSKSTCSCPRREDSKRDNATALQAHAETFVAAENLVATYSLRARAVFWIGWLIVCHM